MTHVLIVGDGPAGLSAALFLAKRGMQVTVLGKDRTDMHRASRR
jgi:thioredoxin reductase (NADPH)